jgi:predicted MPP superfamily phosphohydrolase
LQPPRRLAAPSGPRPGAACAGQSEESRNQRLRSGQAGAPLFGASLRHLTGKAQTLIIESMRTFLIVFFLIYAAAHLYVFMKARAALSFGAAVGAALALFMLLMIAAPVIVRMAERADLEAFARGMSYVGYVWLGLLFLFFSAAVAIDVYRALLYVGALLLRRDFYGLLPTAVVSFYVPLVFAVIASACGYFEARDIRTERVTVRTSKLPGDIQRLRIVQISDVHLGLIVRRERLGRILERVKAAGPDMLVCTGDLVDGQINSLAGLAEALAEIRPRYGKYAVTGNHEFYAGLPHALEFTREAGFTVLRGEAVSGVINIAGVDDPTAKYFGLGSGLPEGKLLQGLPPGKFTLFLKHRPLLKKESEGLFDLQLSGHTHKGQIFPFTVVVRLYYPVGSGTLVLPGGSVLHVSRGSGTWGPPVRFLAPPEVTVIDVVNERAG